MNEQETVADIIAEMRGARTEFPFVYLMGEPDTPEVIDFKTKAIIEPRKINMRRVTVKELADRIEAAYKREKAAIEADALAVGGIVEAARKRERGNAAKLREAVKWAKKKAEYIARHYRAPNSLTGNIMELLAYLNAALAAPPRNCDVGSAMEQGERFSAYCRAHKHSESECLHCPLFGQTGGYCELAWAQIPYVEKEGGNNAD